MRLLTRQLVKKRYVYKHKTWFVSVHVPRNYLSKRFYFTTVGPGPIHTATPTSISIKVKETAVKLPGVAENYVVVPAFPGGTEVQNFDTRMSLIRAWHQLNTPNAQIVPIVSTHNFRGTGGLKLAEKFLLKSIDEGGFFKNILVVKGSSPYAIRSGHEDDVFWRMCEMVNWVQPGSLALVLNQYLPHELLLEDIGRKSRYMPVRYFSHPMFYLDQLPKKTVLLLEQLMRSGEIELTIGLLRATMLMYEHQSMPAPSVHRVTEGGQDRYVGMKLTTSGEVDLGYVEEVLGWVRRHHRRPAQAIQTRHGLGIDASPLIASLNGTVFDLRTTLPVIPRGGGPGGTGPGSSGPLIISKL